MYEAPRQLSELDAQANTGALLFRAASSVDDGAWQYRLYEIGPEAPAQEHRGRFLLVRVSADQSVRVVAPPQLLSHAQWADALLDRLWEAMQGGWLPPDDFDETPPEAAENLTAAEQALVATVTSGPVLAAEGLVAEGGTRQPNSEGITPGTAVSPRWTAGDFNPGDRVEHLADRADHVQEPDAVIEAVVVGPNSAGLADEGSAGDLLVQDLDGDDMPYRIDLNMVVSRNGQRAASGPDSAMKFQPRSQDDLAPSGPLTRMRANISAIRTLHTLRAEERPATPDEQAVLARWSSWGAVPGIFDSRKREFASLRTELRSLLSEEEWFAAEATTRNAHFTDASLVRPIWEALQDLGFQGGRVLEPGCGSGNFLAFAPDGAQITGVELDPITAEIAASLYPDADVREESFVATRFPEGYFDATIGNVPFDEIALTDPIHNPLRLPTHNHFIVKSLELTRPGGLVVVITSRYTLDSMGKTSRMEIADRADLVGAVRLPAGAHRRAAGTDAVTDVLVFRRREGAIPDTPPEWVGLSPVSVGGNDHALVNSYFAKRPEMVMGTIGLTSSQFTDRDITVLPDEGRDLTEALADALAEITRQAREDGLAMSPSPDAAQRAAVEERAERMRRAQEMFGEELQRFEGTLLDQQDETFLQVVGGELAERPVYKNATSELRSLLALRDTYVELLGAESAGQGDEATVLRQRLNQRYDVHVDKYGFLNLRDSRRDRRSAHGAFRTDPYAAGIYALEIFDKDSGRAKKSAIFEHAVASPDVDQVAVDTPQDALAISLSTFGEVRLSNIAELLGTESLDEAREELGDLVYNEPGTQKLVPAAEYVSGDIREKLDQVEQILRMVSDESREEHPFQANAAALRQVLPPDKQPGDIEDVQMGATWIEPKYYQEFLQQLLQSRFVTVKRVSGADWEVGAPSGVKKSRAATKVYGTERRNAVDLAQRMLRRSSLVVKPPKLDENATAEEIRDAKRWAGDQTEQVIAKAEELNRLFVDWLWQDSERTVDVLATYNRLYNSYVPYQGDGSHLTFPGLSDLVTPRPHQRAGVARALAEPNGSFFDYEVGFGKTYTIAMTLMEMKRLGMVRKPSIVVKNSTVNDFRNDFLRAYPRARVLAIDSAEFTKETAGAYIAQIANGDWDAVILPQSLFKRIPMSGRGQAQFVADQTAEYRARIHQVLTGSEEALSSSINPGGDPLLSEALDSAVAAASLDGRTVATGTRETVKKLQGDLKRHTQRAEKNLVKQSATGISWEQTGIDFIAVDEVQDFANGEVGANNSELALTVSAQAKDLKVKLRNMAKAYGPKVGLGSTGTPFPNAMPQAYVMLDYFRPDLLEKAEISAFSSFQAQYLMEVVAPEISPEGVPRIKERIGAFRNSMPFHHLWKAMADVKTKYDITLPVPKSVSETVVVSATEMDRLYMAEIADRAEMVRGGDVDPATDNLLKISNDGRMAAMDLRMVGVTPDGPGKLDAAAEKIAAIWAEFKDRSYTDREGVPSPLPGALQLVFADRGTASEENRKKGKFIAYDYLRDVLIEKGVPEDQIRYAQEARTAEEKAQLFNDCRLGKIAILIGSTETMGVGVNVQDRAIALHHIDCPWRPSDVTQREGRIVRQFNQHFNQGIPVQIHRWVKEGSFDSFMWQTVERKARFIDQVRTGRDLEEQSEGQTLDGDLGKDYLEFGEIKAIATGNPLLLKKMQADEEVRQLEAAYTNWKRTNSHLRNVVDTADETLEKAHTRATLVGRAVGVRVETGGDAFRMELPSGKVLTRRSAAADELRSELSVMHRQMRGVQVGRYEPLATVGGQEILVRINEFHDYVQFTIRGLNDVPQASFTVDDVDSLIHSQGKNLLGLVTRLENHVEKLPQVHAQLLGVVDEVTLEIERAKKLVDQPFAKMDKLTRARADQAQLESDIESQAGGGGDEDDTQPHDAAVTTAEEVVRSSDLAQGQSLMSALEAWADAVKDRGQALTNSDTELSDAVKDAIEEVSRENRAVAAGGRSGVEHAMTRPALYQVLTTADDFLRELGSADELGAWGRDAQSLAQGLSAAVGVYLDHYSDGFDRDNQRIIPAQAVPDPSAEAGTGTTAPYEDRAESYLGEEAVVWAYRAWAELDEGRLREDTPEERELAAAAESFVSERQEGRQSRLLGLEYVMDWQVTQSLAQRARRIAEQLDRAQAGRPRLDLAWALAASARNHAGRYQGTVGNRESDAFRTWNDTSEPIVIADADAVEFMPGLALDGEYVVTGPMGVTSEPRIGADLAAGLAQLIADGTVPEETELGLSLVTASGSRFEVRRFEASEVSSAEGVHAFEPSIGGVPETQAEPPSESATTTTHLSSAAAADSYGVLSSIPSVARLSVLLGPYSDGSELAAGAKRVAMSVGALGKEASLLDPAVETEYSALYRGVTEAAAVIDESEVITPDESFLLYDGLAMAASRLADSAVGALADMAQRLASSTERHLARMQAKDPQGLFDSLADAATLGNESFAVTYHSDPLQEAPLFYLDRTDFNAARSLVFEPFDSWPHAYDGEGGEYTDQLRGAMWEIRQASDLDIGSVLPSWTQVVSCALGAAEEAEQGVSRTVLRDLAQRAYGHHQRLASFKLESERNARAYPSERGYVAGADSADNAWTDWLATDTAKTLAERTPDQLRETGMSLGRAGQDEVQEARYSADWASVEDGTLDQVNHRATKLAHATYALLLSLRIEEYQNPDDADTLTKLVRSAYGHAASLRASVQSPQAAAAVKAGVEARQARLRAEAESNSASQGEQGADEAVLEIEHHYRGTVVRGTTNEEKDAPLRAALTRHKFKFSSRQGFWYLKRQMSHPTRDAHVRQLTSDLWRLKRKYALVDTPPAQTEGEESVIPAGEPYSSKVEAEADFGDMFGALWRMRDTPAGQRLLRIGVGARPDGEAVWKALEALRGGAVGSSLDPFVHPAEDVVTRCIVLAQSVMTMARNLEEERYRAPVAMGHFKRMTQYATHLASRVTATAAQDGLWEQVFSIHGAEAEQHPAAATPEPSPAASDSDEERKESREPPLSDSGSAALRLPPNADPMVAGVYSKTDLENALVHLSQLHDRLGSTKSAAYTKNFDDYDAWLNSRRMWADAMRIGSAALRDDHPVSEAVTAWGAALGSLREFDRELELGHLPDETKDLVNRLVSDTESHVIRLTLTQRAAEESEEEGRLRREREREAAAESSGASSNDERAQKRADVESVIDQSNAKTHERARSWAVQAALENVTVQSWFTGKSENEVRSLLREWLRVARVPDDPLYGERFGDWFRQSGTGVEDTVAAQAIDDVYAALSRTAEPQRTTAAPALNMATEAQPDSSGLAETQDVEPEVEEEAEVMAPPPGKAGEIAVMARTSGWEVSERWDNFSEYSPPHYELTLRATTAQGDRHFVLRWAMHRGRHTYDSQHSRAVHHADKSAKSGFRPKLSDVQRAIRAPALAPSSISEPAGTGTGQDLMRDRLGAAGPEAGAAAAGGETEPRGVPGTATGTPLAEEHLRELPRRTGEWHRQDARLAITTTLAFRNGQVRNALLLLQAEQEDPEFGEPSIRGVQIVPPNELVSSSAEGNWSRADLLAMADARVLPLGTPIPRARIEALVDLPYEAAIRALDPFLGVSSRLSTAPFAVGAEGGAVETEQGAAQQATTETLKPQQVAEPSPRGEEESVTTAAEPTSGAWSSRIQIVRDATGTYVTGTGGDYWQQEGDLRALLKKDRAFGFEGGRWRYKGTLGRRDAVLTEIRAFLAAKDAQELAVSEAAVRKYPPTPQQQAVIDAVAEGKNVSVQALAGTGKTSTMLMVAERHLDRRIAYVAFNRSIADEANAKFGSNVTARTSHSFALQDLRNTPYRHKVSIAGPRNSGARRPKDIASALRISAPIKAGDTTLEPEDIAKLVMGAVRRFRQSADPELGRRHLGEKWGRGAAGRTLLQYARRAWEDIADPHSNKIIFDHDDYLKIWALSNPRLNYDMIIFDEAQDINEVLKEVIQDQPTQTIVVGDSNQAIYEFRGAVDALKDWPADVVLPLTQSWRFGPAVAAVGNQHLQLLGSDLVLEGNPALDTSLGPVAEPDAILTRTNVGAIGAVFAGFDAGKRVALVGGGRDIEEIARAARDLQQGRRTKHPELSEFGSWHEVREYAETDEDAKSLQMFVRLVDRYTPQGLLDMIRDLVPEDSGSEETRPQLVVSTAHKAKGREWDRVQIWGDFPQPKEDTQTGELQLPSHEELRLAYVTATRARERLDLGSLDWIHTVGSLQEVTQAGPVLGTVQEQSPSEETFASETSTQNESALMASPNAPAQEFTAEPLGASPDEAEEVQDFPPETSNVDEAVAPSSGAQAEQDGEGPEMGTSQPPLTTISDPDSSAEVAEEEIQADAALRASASPAVSAEEDAVDSGAEASEPSRERPVGEAAATTAEETGNEPRQQPEAVSEPVGTPAHEAGQGQPGSTVGEAAPGLSHQPGGALPVGGDQPPLFVSQDASREAGNQEPAQGPDTALAPLPWNADKIKKRATAGIRRDQTSGIPSLARDVREAIGDHRVRDIWEQDNGFRQFEVNLRHTLDVLEATAPDVHIVVEQASQRLRDGLGEISDRARAHFEGLARSRAGDSTGLTELDEQWAQDRHPEIGNPFVREALILVLSSIDETERMARRAKAKPATARDALEQVVGLAGTSSVDGQLWPHVDAALTPVKVVRDQARELIAELMSNTSVAAQYAEVRGLIAEYEARSTEPIPEGEGTDSHRGASVQNLEADAPAGDPISAPAPLSDRDVAAAFGKFSAPDFGDLLAGMRDFKVSTPPHVYESSFPLPTDNDEGTGHVLGSVYSIQGGLEMEVKEPGGEVLRAGKISWAKAIRWLRPALTPERVQLLVTTRSLWNDMRRSEPGFEALGEQDRWKIAEREVTDVLKNAQDRTISEALELNETGGAEKRIAQLRGLEQFNEEAPQTLLSIPALTPEAGADVERLERMAALRSVLSTENSVVRKLSEAQPGDMFQRVSEEALWFIVHEPAVVDEAAEDSQVSIVGDLVVGPGELRPYVWKTGGTTSTDHAHVEQLPQSLKDLISLSEDDQGTTTSVPNLPNGMEEPAVEQTSGGQSRPATHDDIVEVLGNAVTADGVPYLEMLADAATEAAQEQPEPAAPEEQPTDIQPREEAGVTGAEMPGTEADDPSMGRAYVSLNDFLTDAHAMVQAYEAWAGSPTGRLLLSEAQELLEETGVSDANEGARVHSAFHRAQRTIDGARTKAYPLMEGYRNLLDVIAAEGRSLSDRQGFASSADRELLLRCYSVGREQLTRLETTYDVLLETESAGTLLLPRHRVGTEPATSADARRDAEPPEQISPVVADVPDLTAAEYQLVDTLDPAREEIRETTSEDVAPEAATIGRVGASVKGTTSSESAGDGDDFDFFRDVIGGDLVVGGVVYNSGEWEHDGEGGVRRKAAEEPHEGSSDAELVERQREALIETMEEDVATAEAPAEGAREPANGSPEIRDDLAQHFDDIVEMFKNGPTASEASRPTPRPNFSVADEAALRGKYEALRSQLSRILVGVDGEPITSAEDSSVEASDAAALEAAMINAESEASQYWGTPEWEVIRSVSQAGRGLRTAVGEAMGVYAEGVVRDVRSYGLNRAIEARVSRAISHTAFLLARRVERSGNRNSRGWRAVWGLHRAAANRADRLTGVLPAGQRTDLAEQLGGAWKYLTEQISSRFEGHRTGRDEREPAKLRTVLSDSYSAIRGIYGAVAERIGDLGQTAAWRRVSSVWAAASEAFETKIKPGTFRLSADREVLGIGRTLWVRTLEVISHAAQGLVDRLGASGHEDGLRWHLLRTLRHSVEDHIAQLRGHLPQGERTPLGTYEAAVTTGKEVEQSQETTAEVPAATTALETEVSATTRDPEASPQSSAEEPQTEQDRFRAVVGEATEKLFTLDMDLVYNHRVPLAEAKALLERMEEIGIVSPPREGGVRDVLVETATAMNILDARQEHGGDKESPDRLWTPENQALRTRWFDEVKAALPRDPKPEGGLSRSDMISVLYHVNTRVMRKQTTREGAGQRANEAMELYLQGRGDEVLEHLAGDGLVYVRGTDGTGWDLQPSPAADVAAPEASLISGPTPLPQRRRPAGGESEIAQSAVRTAQAGPATDRSGIAGQEFAAQADRMRARAKFTKLAASTPAEERRAETLLRIAESSQSTADRLAASDRSSGEENNAGLTADAFIAALRTQAQARGAQLPDDLVNSAMKAAKEAAAGAPRRSPAPSKPSTERPVATGSKKAQACEEAQRRTQGQSNTPSGVRR
ncbi:UvrD-helicase domain-containing protein [Streptomyces hygroscopicus]|uniref:UvrD-helicase domain-containing protein n=1 Tax=Streptomyces hygroscopicus TaxID=1912 RepID=UPI001FCBDD8C|nr:UvrD-helicase domain-containing protein [Streptomyces hygroscopicus]BDH10476.1 hypothetical protein HOK021_16550 [Streptomyces hygroscopicus]